MTDRLSQLGYDKARRLLLAAGLIVLAVVALLMYVRSVDSVEVAAALLYMPIFVGLAYKGTRGGLIAAVLASLVYTWLRYPAIDAVGFGHFAGLIASRTGAYLVFGLVGGWCNETLESSLDKLELYDQVDDDTGLMNARFFLQQTDLETARAKRYQTIYSVVRLSVPTEALAALSRRKRASLLKELGRQLHEGVRTVDYVVHGRFGDHHLFAAILPETSAAGAEVFRARFADRVRQFLVARGAAVAEGDLESSAFAFPGDDAALESARADFARVDEHEHAHAAAVV